MGWEGKEQWSLLGEEIANRNGLAGHGPLLFLLAGAEEASIQLLQTGGVGERHQESASSVAHQVLHAALLPACCRISEDRLEAIDTAEVRKGFLLSPDVALHHGQHG